MRVFPRKYYTIVSNGIKDFRTHIKECWVGGQGYFMGPLSAPLLDVGQSDNLVA